MNSTHCNHCNERLRHKDYPGSMRVILETHGGDAGEAYLHEFCIVPWFDKVRTTFAEEIGVT